MSKEGYMVNNFLLNGIKPAMRGCRLSFKNVLSDSDNDSFGDKDYALAVKLFKSGDDHAAFLRMIQTWFELEAPLYFWKQWDKYKWVNQVENDAEERSESTMHTILKDEFKSSQFQGGLDEEFLKQLNHLRKEKNFKRLVQLLPQSYKQVRMVNTNLMVLLRMIKQRQKHRLGEWILFCDEVERHLLRWGIDVNDFLT
jgi:hypothetical protein